MTNINRTKKTKLILIKKKFLEYENEHLEARNQSDTEEKKIISRTLKRIISLDQENCMVTTNALCLLKRILGLNPPEFKKGDLLKIFVVCAFISFKFLDEELLLEIPDIARLTGYKKRMLRELEKSLLMYVLGFRVFIPQEEIFEMESELQLLACC